MEMNTPRTSAGAGEGPAGGTVAAPAALAKPNGPAVAVMLAAGIGALVLGLLTTVTEASTGLHDFLEFSERVGPLSGKTIFGAGAFLCSWGVLHVALKERELAWRPVIAAAIVLIAVALVLTFPPFFQLFETD